MFQNDESRLPLTAHSLRPDCSTINLAEKSEKPENWLLHPTGITFKFEVKYFRRRNPIRNRKRPIKFQQ